MRGLTKLALPTLLLCASVRAGAETVACPHASFDACEQWRLEQAEQELGLAVTDKLAELERRSTMAERNERARALLRDAQREWLRFREAECRARVAADMISARTPDALTSTCLLALARQRIEQVRRF